MNLARQLEEAVVDGAVPWDLHEAYGVKSGDEMYLPRRRQEPKYGGLLGPRYEAAVAKGYIDLGLVDPKVAKELGTGNQFFHSIASRVALILMKRDVAFIRDPEDIMGVKGYDPNRLPALVKQAIGGYFAEEGDEADEAEDEKRSLAMSKAEQEVHNATLAISTVKGKTGVGYKLVMKPSFAEIEKRVR